MQKQKLSVCLKIAGWILLCYGILEMSDVITGFLAIFGVNTYKHAYPAFLFSPVNKMFQTMPLYTFLFTLIPTSMRLISGIGVLKNRSWGFWMAIVVSIYTLCVFDLFLPMGVYDGIITVTILSFILIGKLKKSPII